MLRALVVIAVTVFIFGCIEYTPPPPQPEDYKAKMNWLGEWFIPEEDSGYIFKEDGTVDWFYYKRDKRFVVSNEGRYSVYYTGRCDVQLQKTELKNALWEIDGSLLIIHQPAIEYLNQREVLINLIKADE